MAKKIYINGNEKEVINIQPLVTQDGKVDSTQVADLKKVATSGKASDLEYDDNHVAITKAEKNSYITQGAITNAINNLDSNVSADNGKALTGVTIVDGKLSTYSQTEVAKPSDIPFVGNGKVTIKQNNVEKGSFTMNQSGTTTINLSDNNDNTTYAFSESTEDGNFTVTPSSGSAYNVKIHNVATLNSDGKVYSSQLPSYVSDVVNGYYNSTDKKFYKENTFKTEITGESDKIYINLSDNKTYRWGGSTSGFVVISDTIALGETATTAYYGDKGKTAYNHSQSAHAPSNAQQNVQSDWNATSGDAYIKNKPSALPATGGTADYAGKLGNASAYYTKTSLDTALSGKSDTGHTHSQYSETGHTHTQYASTGHTHTLSNITNYSDPGNGEMTFNTLVGSTTTEVSDFTANQSSGDSLTFQQGDNISITPDTTNKRIKFDVPNGSASAKGVVKVGSNISVDANSVISLSKKNVTDALGYTPPTSDTNTHYLSSTVVAASATGTTNAVSTNGNTHINHLDNGVIQSSNKITGAGATSVTSDANGVITITSTDTNTDTKVTAPSNHYSPTGDTNATLTANASGASAAWSIDVVKGVTIKRDSKGHITDLSVTSGKIPSNPNTDTHYSSKNVVGASSGAYTNATATNGNVYLNHLESNSNTPTSSHKITGAGATTVTSDANGVITITSTDNNTWPAVVDGNPTLAWSTKSTVATIGGSEIHVKMPANPNTDTHYSSSTIVCNTSTGKSNTASTNGNTYINHIENNGVVSSHKITGTGAASVSSDANGVITIHSTDTNTHYTAKNVVANANTGQTATTTANTTTFLNLIENGAVSSSQQIKGKGATTVHRDSDGILYIESTDTNTWPTLANLGGLPSNHASQVATSDTLGHIKIGFTESDKNYPVQLDENNKAFVNVPWTDTNTNTWRGITNIYGSKLSNGDIISISNTAAYNMYVAVTQALNGKSNTGHTHSQYASSSHTHSDYASSTNATIYNATVRGWFNVYDEDSMGFMFTIDSDSNGHLDTDNALYLGSGDSDSIFLTNPTVITSTCTANAFYASSDVRYKEKVNDIKLSAEEISSIPTFTYTWTNKDDKSVEAGTSAQAVKELIPEAVSYDEKKDFYSLDYAKSALIMVKNLADEIVELKKRIKELEGK